MDTKCSILYEDEVYLKAEFEEEEEEEALSLCDLPINKDKQSRKEEACESDEAGDQEFDFCRWRSDSFIYKEPDMCVADEVFFEGQILPYRHSMSSEHGFKYDRTRKLNSSVSSSESMDHFTSSSRSSSLKSSSSGSGSSTTNTMPEYTRVSVLRQNYKPRTRNQFHSYPSPSPRIRSSTIKQCDINKYNNRNSSMWSIFRVGVVTPPEIALHDLRTRTRANNSTTNNNSRHSTSSYSSGLSINNMKTDNKYKNKKMFGFLDNDGLLFGGCKCSVDTAVDAVPLKVAMQRSASSNGTRASEVDDDVKSLKQKQKSQTERKQLSHHRTFEWLKQLSLEDAP